MRKSLLGGLALCAASLAVLSGCGGGGGSVPGLSAPVASAAHNYLGTQSPGDVWNWSLGGSTFSASNITRSTGYSGTSALLESGFYKLTVSTSTDGQAPAGSVAYAFDVPGVAFIAQPAGTLPSPIVGAAVGMNPTGTSRYNWITIPAAHWDNNNSDAYGTAAVTMSDTNNGSISISHNAITGVPGDTHSQAITFSSGEFTTDGSTGLITPAGMIMVDGGPGEGGIFGVKAPDNNIDIADLTSKEYRGIVFLGDGQGGHSELVRVTPNGTGGLSAVAYTDVEANVIDPDPSHQPALTFGAQASPGLINGVIHFHSGPQNIVLAVNKIGGKYMIYGFAADSGGFPDNFLFIQK